MEQGAGLTATDPAELDRQVMAMLAREAQANKSRYEVHGASGFTRGGGARAPSVNKRFLLNMVRGADAINEMKHYEEHRASSERLNALEGRMSPSPSPSSPVRMSPAPAPSSHHVGSREEDSGRARTFNKRTYASWSDDEDDANGAKVDTHPKHEKRSRLVSDDDSVSSSSSGNESDAESKPTRKRASKKDKKTKKSKKKKSKKEK